MGGGGVVCFVEEYGTVGGFLATCAGKGMVAYALYD